MGKREIGQTEHASGDQDASISDGDTNGNPVSMNNSMILALYISAPADAAYLNAESRATRDGMWRPVYLEDGTKWSYPFGNSNTIPTSGAGSSVALGANSFSDFVGLGDIRFVSSVAQTTGTSGWPLKTRVSS